MIMKSPTPPLFTKTNYENFVFEIKSVLSADTMLWASSFMDKEEDISFALNSLKDTGFCASISNKEETLAQFLGIETHFNNRNGFYIYALCTNQKYRNCGYMRALLHSAVSFLRENGYDFVWLFPANKGLKTTYYKLGFKIPVPVGASPSPRSAKDFYLSLEKRPNTREFDGNFKTLYEFSSKVIPFDAFKYSLDCISEITNINYITKDGVCDGYIISCREDENLMLGISEKYSHLCRFNNCNEDEFAYLMPISDCKFDNLKSIEPIIR